MGRVLTVRELAARVGGIATGDPERPLTGVNAPGSVGPDDVVFIESARQAHQLSASAAGAVILPHGVAAPPHMSAIAVDDPALAMICAVELLVAPPRRAFEGVSPLAFVGRDATMGEEVGVGPFVFIGDRVRIGRGTEIHPGTTIGADTTIGEDSVIHAGVHIYHDVTIGSRVVLHSGAVIGADGFGFVQRPASGEEAPGRRIRHVKVRQLGRVVIEDDVEIGANSAVDRATFHETRVGRGTKIDNLVTVGHNSRIGRDCIIAGQAGVSGSTVVGDGVVIAGQAGVTGHVTIGDGAVIGAQSGVTKSVEPGAVVLGSPAVDARRAKKALALVDSLPEFKKALADVERRLARIERGGE